MGSDQPVNNSRIGIHYFPDTYHYREKDLQKWVPELQSMGFKWITLHATPQRAIPEHFINGLIDAGITPIIKIITPLQHTHRDQVLNLDFEIYAKWGVKHLCVFDRPNLKRSWKQSEWVQEELVEHFLDIYLPIASQIIQYDLIPILPPLEPGGDYWDTTFLRQALHGIERRSSYSLLDKFVIGAYAWLYDRPMNWGAGGPETWPGARPYFTPSNSHDQIGFRIFDWYSAICNSEANFDCKIFILAGGTNSLCGNCSVSKNPLTHAKKNINIARMLVQENSHKPDGENNQIPDYVQVFNFWLLSCGIGDPSTADAWFKPDGSMLPVANAFRQLKSNKVTGKRNGNKPDARFYMEENGTQPIDHYLLLPLFSWGVADWDLDGIRPFIQRYQPTVGFSIADAKLSKRVTIAGRLSSIPGEQIDELKSSGCVIEQLNDDGTILAI